MKKSLLLLLLFLPLFHNYAQNQANIWYFGYNAGLSFNGDTPQVLMDGQLYTNEGCASISDTEGNLLFYTDGITVHTKNHTIMENGTELKGDPSSTHSAIIIPKPGTTTVYYIFTVDALTLNGGGVDGLQYSEVDMSFNGGLGKVTSKNNLLHTPVNEKVTAVKKEDSDEYWVVAHKYDSYQFITYDVTASGINTTALVSEVGATRSTRTTGQIKIAPDGSKLAVAWTGNNVELFNFNINTGKVGNLITTLNPPGNPYGIEFSPNSNLLYSSYYPGVSQYNLQAGSPTDIANSGVVLYASTYEPFSSMQLGPDAKIYVAKANQRHLDVIATPNILGTDANYKYNEIFLNERRSGLGLPTFVSNTVVIGNISASNFCFREATFFSYSDAYDSIEWDFGDGNSSTTNNISHTYLSPGTYDVKVHITVGTSTFSENKSITIFRKPVANPINNIVACETTDGSGISSTINTLTVNAQVIAGQTNISVKYFDEAGNELPSPLPNPFTNTTPNTQTITAQVYNVNNPQCYSETSFDLIVTSLPQVNPVADLVSCDRDTDGITTFDSSNLRSDLVGSQPNLEVSLIHENGQQLTEPLPQTLTNKVPHEETITAQVTNTLTGCTTVTSFKLIVSAIPDIGNLPDLIGCDDNNDGISEYFNTAQIETLALQGQTGMEVTYYNASGNLLPGPLPDPYINSLAYNETLTVRVSNTQSGCYAETTLNLITSAQPQINTPAPRFACDAGNGYSSFDLTDIEQEVIGSQTGLTVQYSDESGDALATPPSANFQNTTAWSQRINIRVENEDNARCFSETYLNLKVNELPQLNIDERFVICDNEPGLQLSRSEIFDFWQWEDPAGNRISSNSEAYLTQEGSYTLTVGELQNGIMCTNSYSFTLERSAPPMITTVDFADWSDHNFIEVTATGDGVFEYSVDGEDYQDSNYFPFLKGGVYTVSVRDKAGCGLANTEVVLVDYPKVFTPNGDGYHDYWQIEGIEAFLDAQIFIFDRYGKLLKQLSPQETGWDGSYTNQNLPSADYWFEVNLGNGRIYKNHFTLKR